MHAMTVVALAMMAFGGTEPAQALSAQPEKGIDIGTVLAFQKLGAEYGGIIPNKFGYVSFVSGFEAAGQGLPGFLLPSREKLNLRVDPIIYGRIPKLPQVDVPFGLDLYETAVADEGLRELAGQKKLIWLSLTQTRVTDGGMKHLKDLQAFVSAAHRYQGHRRRA